MKTHHRAERDHMAGRLEIRREHIRREYGARLHQIGSALVSDQEMRIKVLEQADSAVDDVSGYLRGDTGVPERGARPTEPCPLSGLVHNVHPGELVRAAGELFEIVIRAAAEAAPPGEAGCGLVAGVSVALQRSIMARLGQASSAFVRILLHEIQLAQVSERRRIARELHDRVGQAISAADRQLELYERYRDTDPARAAVKAELARTAVRNAIVSTRQATSDLRLQVQEESLQTALRLYIEAMDVPHVQTDVLVTGDESWIPPETRDSIFLVVREALRNVFVHSHAASVSVILEIAPNGCYAHVSDNGVGFELQAADARWTAGLAIIRERVALLGGTLGVFSRPGAGTSVRLLVPLAGNRDESPV